ncbi:MAG: vitamin B12-dependent ribonucleotide reductase [Patescibacteria group bacterium]|jgi:ribonucleoside-diphosphate reductase alpha chain
MLKSKEIRKIKKRDGRVVPFDQERITNAIYKAAQAVGQPDQETAKKLSKKVVEMLRKNFDETKHPTVEQIQDIVEETLVKERKTKIAKAYILYRKEHQKLRETKGSLVGVNELDTNLSVNALRVLSKRYFRKDVNGKVLETPSQLFSRVAQNIAKADLKYDSLLSHPVDLEKTEEAFCNLLANLDFVPNSPTLMNAGKELQQLAACFVIPVGDSMEEIFDAVKWTAMVHKTGGGTGFSFSRLRPKNDRVMSTKGVASGPVSFMTVFDAATETIKQGGTRRGANMGILRVDHPDVLEFITAKENNDKLNNFNISVAVTEDFMRAVENGEDYDLINPKDKKPIDRLNARKVFDLILTLAWKNGDPGIVFIDRINKDNPTPKVGEIESTNPCGEQPLLPFEACNLGSINLAHMVKGDFSLGEKAEVDWERLRKTIRTSIHFLDNVIDMSAYPLPQIEKMVHNNRKIGLGVMGWADLLIMLCIPYDSEEAVELAEKLMKFIADESRKMSQDLALDRGQFPNFEGSIFDQPNAPKMRNATTNTIAPTGTISIIAGCSSGIEPIFAISYIRNVMDDNELIEVNPLFETIARHEGFYSEELMKKIAESGGVQGLDEVPAKWQRVFVVSHDITPEWHLRMQSVFQKHTDNAVSKTVNFPTEATPSDIEKVYMLAYRLGCKGVTIYRDKSRETQVLNIAKVNHKVGKKTFSYNYDDMQSNKQSVPDAEIDEHAAGSPEPREKVKVTVAQSKSHVIEECPDCKTRMEIKEGCSVCPHCGFSACSLG